MSEDVDRRAVHRVLEVVLKLGATDAEHLVRSRLHQWDSLKHMEIVFALEEQLGVEFSESEMPSLDSLEAIVEAVRRKREA